MDKNATAMTVADRNAMTGKKDKNGRTLASLSQSRLDLIDRQSLSDDEEMSENKPTTATEERVTVSKNAAVAIGEKMVCLTLTSEHLDHVVWRYKTTMKQSVEKWKLVLDILENDETPLADIIRAVKAVIAARDSGLAESREDTRILQIKKYIAEFRSNAREAAPDKAKADAESEVHQQELEVLKKEWMASLRKQVEEEIRPKLADQVRKE